MVSEFAVLGTTIEITTVIGFSLLVLFGLMGYFKKVSVGIAFFSGIAGFVIGWVFAPYNAIIIGSMGNAIWYGYDWSLMAVLGLFHMLTIFLMVGIAAYNLYRSEGKIIWA